MHTSISLLLVSALSIPLSVVGGISSHATTQSLSATPQERITSRPEKASSSSSDNCTTRGCGRRYEKRRGSGRLDSQLSDRARASEVAQTLLIQEGIAARGSGRIDSESV
jgi:hypothetical protein